MLDASSVPRLIVLSVVVWFDGASTTTATPTADAGGVPVAAGSGRTTPASAPFEGLTEVHAAIGYDRCLRLVVADSTATSASPGCGPAGDLGPYDGMLFVFQAPANRRVHDVDGAVPLDIGFFER